MSTTLADPSARDSDARTSSPATRPLARRLQWITRAIVASIVLLLLAALYFRWDRVGHLHDPRWQVILSLIGFAVATWYASIQARGFDRFPRTTRISVLGLACSQVFYLLLVWTTWKMSPTLWRFWWLTVVLATTCTHVVWLRLSAPVDRRTFLRCTIACALIAGALVVVLAFRKNIIADPHPAHVFALVLFTAGSAFGSVVLWARALRQAKKKVPLPVKVGWAVVAQVGVVLIAFYVGRLTAPQPSIFDLLPSPLASMQPEELESQLRADFERLKIIVAGLDELAAKSKELTRDLTEKRRRENRDVYTPAEEDRIRAHFMSFLAYRAALLRLVANYAGFEVVPDPAARARCMLVGYAAGATVYRTSLALVSWYGEAPAARRKLNEPDSRAGIPAGMYDRILENVTAQRNLDLMAEMEAHYLTHRERWATAGVLPESDYDWIAAQLDRCSAEMKTSTLDQTQQWGSRLERLVAKVRQDTYTPMYTAQSMVSTWIGDTRLVKWTPFIRHEQILAMRSQLRPGDILLERRNWFLSNAFLPGFWPHAAIYVGTIEDMEKLGLVRRDEKGRWTSDHLEIRLHLEEYLKPAPDGQPHTVLESVSEGVIANSLTESMHADYVAVLRPRLGDDLKAQAIARAFAHVGKPYDFEFDFFSADKLVCTELVYRAYDGLLKFELEKIMGRETLPALKIASTFAEQRNRPDRQLDFILFLDGVPATHSARLADEETFVSSIAGPRGYNE